MRVSNISSSIIGPVATKVHIESRVVEGTKICSNCPGHVTSMATTPKYGKTLLKSSTPEPIDQWP